MKEDKNKLGKRNIMELTNKMVKNFESLNSGTLNLDNHFIRDLKNFMSDNFQKGDLDKKKLRTKRGFIRELRKQAVKQDFIVQDYFDFIKKIKESEKMLQFYLESRLKKVKKLRKAELDLKKHIDEFNLEKELKEREKSARIQEIRKQNDFTPSPINPHTKKNLLLLPIRSPFFSRGSNRKTPRSTRSRRRSGVGSPIYVLQITVTGCKSEIENLENNIESCKQDITEYKIKKDQCQSLLKKNINFLLKYPDVLHDLGFKILNCIKNLLKIEEFVTPDQIGGNFLYCEKEYLLKYCKIQMKWAQLKLLNDKFSLQNKLMMKKSKRITISRSKTFKPKKRKLLVSFLILFFLKGKKRNFFPTETGE